MKQNLYHAPIRPSNYFRRERLNNFLKESANCSLIIISGGAGYGKTTLISDFIREQGRYIWINIYDNPLNQNIFFKILLESFSAVEGISVINTQTLFESYLVRNDHDLLNEKSIENLIFSLINELNKSKKDDLNLVFDDFHLIGSNSWAINMFNGLIEHIPENLHIYLTTRSIPDLNISQLIVAEKYSQINVQDLLFTKEDLVGLYSASGLSDVNTSKYFNDLENFSGWITGINLTLEMIKNMEFDFAVPQEEYPENIFNILSMKMIDTLDEPEKKFLLLTSLLEVFDKDICCSALGISDFDKMISFFESKFSFIIGYEKEDGLSGKSYRYITLMRNLLRSLADQYLEKNNLKLVYTKLFEYLYIRGSIEDSFVFLELSEEYEKLYVKLKLHYEILYKSGHMDLIWSWLILIKKHCVIKDPYLYIFLSSLSKYYEKDANNTELYLDEAERISRANNDTSAIARITILKSDILINNNQTIKAVNILIDNLNDSLINIDKLKIKFKLAFAYYANSDYFESESVIRAIIDTNADMNDLPNYYECFNLIGHINLIRGDFTNALNYYSKFINTTVNIIAKFETLCNLVLLYSLNGKKIDAKEKLEALKSMYEDFQIPIFKIPYQLSEQSYNFEFGNYSESINILQSIRESSVENNNRRYIYLSSRLLADCYYYLNDKHMFLKYLKEASLLIDKSNELEHFEFLVLNALKEMKYSSQLDKAGKLLNNAYEYFKVNNMYYSLAQTIYHLSVLNFEKQNYENTIKYFSEFFDISIEKGFKSFLKREFDLNDNFYQYIRSVFDSDKMNELLIS